MADKSVRISGGAVRYGATYGGNRLFSAGRSGGGGGGGISMSRSMGFSGSLSRGAGGGIGMGGLGLGLGMGGGLGFGAGAGMGGGLGMGMGGGLGMGLGGGMGAKAAGFRAGVAPLRARLGGRAFKIGGYGFNPSFLSSTTTVSAGVTPVPSIDPSLPSLDTVQVTRLKEKEELQVLNNKFASFIDKVR